MNSKVFALRCRRLDAHTSVIELEGDLDLGSAPQLKRTLVREVGIGQERLVVDLSLVTFMDSTALGVLVGVDLSLRPGGLVIAGAGEATLKLFEVTGLDRAFELFPTVELALSALEQRPLRHPERTDEDLTRAVEAAASVAEEPGHGAGSGTQAQLTGDAAVALGIAATAMPFAESTGDQAEHWLRILRQYGDAAILLTSLGFTDEPRDAGSAGIDPGATSATDTAPGEIVMRQARLHAERHGTARVRTTDLLAAAIEVYGEEFERALTQHGVRSEDVVEQIELGVGRSIEDPPSP